MSEPTCNNELARLICCAAYHAHVLATTSEGPRARHYAKRASGPRVGDMVVETTAFGKPRAVPGLNAIAAGDFLRCVGRLIEIKVEPMPGRDDEANGEPSPTERAFYIESLAGETVRWTNCRFVVIPEDFFRFKEGE